MPNNVNYENLSPEELDKKQKQEAFLYFTAAYLYEIKPAREDKNLLSRLEMAYNSILDNKKEKQLANDILEATRLACEIKRSEEDINDFFKFEEDDQEQVAAKEAINKSGLKGINFSLVAFAASGSAMSKLNDYFKAKRANTAQVAPEDIKAIKGDSIRKAYEALFKYREGDYKVFAKLIAEGLRNSCENFASVPLKEDAVRWSTYTEKMLAILNNNPKLMEASGLTQRQIKIAKNVSELSGLISNGLHTIEVMADMSLVKKVAPTQKQHDKFLRDIYRMQVAIGERQKVAEKWDEPEKKAVVPGLSK